MLLSFEEMMELVATQQGCARTEYIQEKAQK